MEMSVDRRIAARVKMKIYKMIVRPAVVDGLETKLLTEKQKAELKIS